MGSVFEIKGETVDGLSFFPCDDKYYDLLVTLFIRGTDVRTFCRLAQKQVLVLPWPCAFVYIALQASYVRVDRTNKF